MIVRLRVLRFLRMSGEITEQTEIDGKNGKNLEREFPFVPSISVCSVISFFL